MVYLPHFLSWVILAGILRTILARNGMLNDFLGVFGIQAHSISRTAPNFSLGDYFQ
jgi:ABC-type polysaccharide transport system permease subunit